MTIYNFNEVSGGSTPVEVSNLKIGDIIITNRENVAEYEAEGVDLFKLTYYNQIVNAANYPKIAELTDYNYNANIVSTSPNTDFLLTMPATGYRHWIREDENNFLLFPSTGTVLYRLNSDNTFSVLNSNAPTLPTGSPDVMMVNFDNFNKILILYKASNANIIFTVYNKINQSFTIPDVLTTAVDASTGRVFAARLMPDGLIYIGVYTTAGNFRIYRTIDGIVYENYHTDTMVHPVPTSFNICQSDEYGTMNIDEYYRLYFLQQSGTTRTLNYFDILYKNISLNLASFTTDNNQASYHGFSLKNNQIIMFKNQVNEVINFCIFDISNFSLTDYTLSLNNSNTFSAFSLIDYNNLFIQKNTGRDLVYTNDFVNFTQYNYDSYTTYSADVKRFDFRYSNIILMYCSFSSSPLMKRVINVNNVADTLLFPKAPFLNYQADSYLITDIIKGI